MKITVNGYKIPEDNNQNFWSYLEFNINRLDGHSHDGVDSEFLDSSAIRQTSQLINSDWTTIGNRFRTIVTLPSEHEFDHTSMRFFIGLDQIYPEVEKIDDSNYYLYSLANNTEITAYYG